MKIIHIHVTKTPSGKFDFTNIEQKFIDMKKLAANVDYMTSIVQRNGERPHHCHS